MKMIATIALLFAGVAVSADAQVSTPSPSPAPTSEWLLVITSHTKDGAIVNIAPVTFGSEADCKAVAGQLGSGPTGTCVKGRIIVTPPSSPIL